MILLKTDEGLSDPQIMAALNVSRPCVERIRKRFVVDGLERTLNEDPRPGQKRKLDGRAEATLIATACTDAPERHAHWTLRLLAGKLVQLGVVEAVSYETVRRTLKKTIGKIKNLLIRKISQQIPEALYPPLPDEKV